jgi:hypothetical protein
LREIFTDLNNLNFEVMARQKGIIKLKGTIGDITFYKTQDGHLAREKGGIDASRIASDPAFQRTRENGSEFGRAGKAGKLLRTAVRGLLSNSADSRLVSRLTKTMVNVIQADMVSLRGLRNVIDGEVDLLVGFEFNIRGKLGTTLFVPYFAEIDRPTGLVTLNIDAFIPSNMIAAPGGTTHFKITSLGAEIDFEAETFNEMHSETPILPWDSNMTNPISLANNLPAGSTKPLFMAIGVAFFQEINGQMYTLKNGAFNPLAIVKVDSGV